MKTLATLSLALCTGCWSLFIHLPDGGALPIPDAGGLTSLEFDAVMGLPGPILDGGTTMYGGLTFVTTFDGGARILHVKFGSQPFETFIYPHGDDTDVVGTGDINQDGKIDWRYTSTYDGTAIVTTTTLADTDFDGVFDQQDVIAIDVSQGIPYQKTETVSRYLDADGGLAAADAGSWAQLWTYSGTADADQQGPSPRCLTGNGLAGFPSTVPLGNSVFVPKTLIEIIDNGNSGACSDRDTQLLVTAFEQSLLDIAECEGGANPDLARAVKQAVSSRVLFVGCGNDCSGTLASTDLPYASTSQSNSANLYIQSGGVQRMNINPSITLHDSSGGDRDVSQTEEVLIHELLHFAGYDHSPPPAGDPQGHDMVYGCGRYCTACQSGNMTYGWSNNPPTAADFSFDCADCADSARRVGCGTYAQISTECSGAACAPNFDGSTPCDANEGVCCPDVIEACWATGVASLGSRNLALPGFANSACIETGSASAGSACVATPNCTPGQTVNDLGSDTRCIIYPVGWCGIGPEP